MVWSCEYEENERQNSKQGVVTGQPLPGWRSAAGQEVSGAAVGIPNRLLRLSPGPAAVHSRVPACAHSSTGCFFFSYMRYSVPKNICQGCQHLSWLRLGTPEHSGSGYAHPGRQRGVRGTHL